MEDLDHDTLQQLREAQADPYRTGAPLDDIYHASLAVHEAFPDLAISDATDVALESIKWQQAEAIRKRNAGTPFTMLQAVSQRALAIIQSEHAPEDISLPEAGTIAIQGLRHLLAEDK